MTQFIVATICLIFLFTAYMLPTVIAWTQNNANLFWVGILNLFFGWTIAMWFVLLIVALLGRKESAH